MCTISQNSVEDKEPLVIYGPVGLRRYLRTSLLLSQSQLGFDYVVHELLPVPEQFPEEFLVSHLACPSFHVWKIINTLIEKNPT